MLSERCRAAHGRLLAVERRGGGALAAAVEAGAVAHADLVRAELVQAVEREEGGLVAHLDEALEARAGARRCLQLQRAGERLGLAAFGHGRAEVREDVRIPGGVKISVWCGVRRVIRTVRLRGRGRRGCLRCAGGGPGR